ncbi:MAG: hypothetical protein Q7T78_24920 [Rhodoferax sp.]|nr:hypothetical protein [Rhodoferax sp.]
MISLAPTHGRKVKSLPQQGTDITYAINNEPLARAPLPDPASDIAIEDFDVLIGAVKARLRQAAGECAASTTDPQTRDAVVRVQDSVLECVAALDQLHTTLTNELHRRLPR